jgi:hypothetical protein
VDFRFVAPDLSELDVASAELLACCVWSDVRPVRGTAGLVDFRLAGKLSELSRGAFLSGARGEVLLVPGRPKLPFERMLVFGLGDRAAFTDDAYEESLRHISSVLEDLHAPRAVVELPGRAEAAVTAERAAEILASTIRADAHDAWWLVERPDAQKAMHAKLMLDRRAARRS